MHLKENQFPKFHCVIKFFSLWSFLSSALCRLYRAALVRENKRIVIGLGNARVIFNVDDLLSLLVVNELVIFISLICDVLWTKKMLVGNK